MTILRCDIETYSGTDLTKSGVYRYVEDSDFEILLFAYAFDDEPVQVIDFAVGEPMHIRVTKALTDPDVIKTAWNANFERTAIARHFDIECDPAQWRCTMVHALTLGLPASLDLAAKVLRVDAQKDAKGKALIKYFSMPCKPTQVNGGRERNLPAHDTEKWQQFIDYCAQDVEAERAIGKRLERFPVPDHEWRLWALDQQINDRGVRVDRRVVEAAQHVDDEYGRQLVEEATELTGLPNVNSIQQLTAWLADRGVDASGGLTKETVPQLIASTEDEEVIRRLQLRQEMAKTSVTKYQAMDRSVCRDSRVRGLLQFCGANRTWRWAGRLVQVQNLPQNKVEDLENARETLLLRDAELMKWLYGSPPFLLSQLVRTAFIPDDGKQFIVSDFNAIEARVIAWLADETWVLQVFEGHGKIYEATAAQMFGVPVDSISKTGENYALRQRGKVAQLACGYGGGVNALITMGAVKGGIPEDDLPALVKQWRQANPNIVKLWYRCEEAAMTAIQEQRRVPVAHGVAYRYEAGLLFAELPSGRSLAYWNARIEPDPKFKKDSIVFDGMDQTTKQWRKIRTWGGTLVENLVQAIARDCLAESMIRLDEAGMPIVMHVHDEVIIEADADVTPEEVDVILGVPAAWAEGLPLAASGFACSFYQKD